MYSYSFLLCKILQILQFFNYTNIHGAVGKYWHHLTLYREFVLAAIITMRLLTLGFYVGMKV